MARRALICGISGQDGAYLAKLLVDKGYDVHGTSRDCEANSFSKLLRLGIRGRVTAHSMQLTDFRSVLAVLSSVEPDEIYNLSGQSSVGLSFDQPLETFRFCIRHEQVAFVAVEVVQLPHPFANPAMPFMVQKVPFQG